MTTAQNNRPTSRRKLRKRRNDGDWAKRPVQTTSHEADHQLRSRSRGPLNREAGSCLEKFVLASDEARLRLAQRYAGPDAEVKSFDFTIGEDGTYHLSIELNPR